MMYLSFLFVELIFHEKRVKKKTYRDRGNKKMGSKPINNKPNDATPLASNTAQSVMIDKPVDVDMNQSIFSTSKPFFEKGKSSNPSTVSIGKPITLKNNKVTTILMNNQSTIDKPVDVDMNQSIVSTEE